MRHAALVVNPMSGKHRGEAIGEQATRRLRSAGWTVDRVTGDDVVSVRSSLAAVLAGGADTVVVTGGDGALHGILDLLVEADATLGLLPAGTGNDLARALELPYRDAEACLDVLLSSTPRRIDLARVDGAGESRLVATVVASGFDSKVNERANAMTWPRGNMRYNIAIVAELRAFSPIPFTLELTDAAGEYSTVETDAMLVAIGNGPSFGGGLRIAHGASLYDGLLDVCLIRPVSRTLLIRTFPKLTKGTHVSMPEFERYRVRSVRIDAPGIVAYGDGERLGALPLTAEVLPGALSVLAPPTRV
ncbi:diacylglycerol kinase family protein [Aeromicrobium sp. Leaf350]|uniref:diacylglycerol kinase family protein n=1 Tax=Aeromicrobium sp. Leaf350 TaxID=2876565 RepID=UPI001E2A86D0|nr:diacylglycerol kinase family protein [Aeromicrobium sp. Leaf350]